MAGFYLRRRRSSLPEGVQQPAQRWLERGLKSAYLLRPGLWSINLVTGQVGGSLAGSGFSFVNNKLRTPNVAGDGATLQHGLALNVAVPISLVVGSRVVAGSVAWSLLGNTGASGDWNGWYGADSYMVSVVNNVFDGEVHQGLGPVAFRSTSTELVAYGESGQRAMDVVFTLPGGLVNVNTVSLGWARRNISDNSSQTDFTHFYAFQSALTDNELLELQLEPGRLFTDRRIFVSVSGVSSATLAATGGSGALVASAWAETKTSLAATGASGSLVASAYTPATATLAATGATGTLSASAGTGTSVTFDATGTSGTLAASAYTSATATLGATGGSGTFSATASTVPTAALAALGGSGALIASAWAQTTASLAATGASGALSAAASVSSGSGASAADVWAYVLSNGKTADANVTEIHAMLSALTKEAIAEHVVRGILI